MHHKNGWVYKTGFLTVTGWQQASTLSLQADFNMIGYWSSTAEWFWAINQARLFTEWYVWRLAHEDGTTFAVETKVILKCCHKHIRIHIYAYIQDIWTP